jgi:hypothetical protein
VVVAGDVRKKTSESGSTTLTQINPEVIREWPHSVGTLDSSKQTINFGKIVGGRPLFDVEMRHNP